VPVAEFSPIFILSKLGGLWSLLSVVAASLIRFYGENHLIQYVVDKIYLTRKTSPTQQLDTNELCQKDEI